MAQKGNALFLILIAVALFAALSYAITQSGRGGGNISKEQATISAAQVTEFAAVVRNAVTRMLISGTQVNTIDYDTSASGDGAVFAADGGGVTYQSPPNNIGNAYGGADGTVANTWGFKDLKDAAKGYYMKNVGTNNDVTGREALAYLNDISESVCGQINKGLGLDGIGQSAAVDFADGGGLGEATLTAGKNYVDGNGGAPFICMINGNAGAYVYYHALIEQ